MDAELHDYIEERFAAHEKLGNERDLRYQQRHDDAQRSLQAALAASERAVAKAEASIEERLRGMNEFRATVTDLVTGFNAAVAKLTAELMPRSEANQRFAALTEKVDAIAATVRDTQGRDRGLGMAWAAGIAIVGVLIAAAAIAVALWR